MNYHDKMVRKLANRYFNGSPTNIEFFGDARGEIDIYAFKDDVLYLVEYKTSNHEKNFKKAVYQLRKEEQWVVPYGIDYELVFMWGNGKYKHIHSNKCENDRNKCSKLKL